MPTMTPIDTLELPAPAAWIWKGVMVEFDDGLEITAAAVMFGVVLMIAGLHGKKTWNYRRCAAHQIISLLIKDEKKDIPPIVTSASFLQWPPPCLQNILKLLTGHMEDSKFVNMGRKSEAPTHCLLLQMQLVLIQRSEQELKRTGRDKKQLWSPQQPANLPVQILRVSHSSLTVRKYQKGIGLNQVIANRQSN